MLKVNLIGQRVPSTLKADNAFNSVIIELDTFFGENWVQYKVSATYGLVDVMKDNVKLEFI